MLEGGASVSGVRGEAEVVPPVSTGAEESGPALNDADTESDGPDNESAHDTVARILRDAESTGEDNDETPSPRIDVLGKKDNVEVIRDKQGSKQPGVQKRDDKKDSSFQIPPPNRLTVEQKEIFHQLPDGLKRAAHKMFQDHEAQQTKWTTEASRAFKESSHVVEAVRPYLLAHPELAEQGYTESRFVSALVAAHQKLTDPKTARQTWLDLGAQVGVSTDVLEGLRQAAGATADVQDISRHPQFVALQKRLDSITSKLDGADAKKSEGEIARKISEVQNLREERDFFGKYKYPKLHDGEYLRTKVKPLVSALEATLPNLSYGELVRKAHDILEGGNSSQVNQARFPDPNGQVERARHAAVSIRGRSAPSSASRGVDEIPQEALGDAESSVRWALDQLRAGKNI